jgi:hypothetical protein
MRWESDIIGIKKAVDVSFQLLDDVIDKNEEEKRGNYRALGNTSSYRVPGRG